jgi:predicted phage terminase large subunit-like protein
MNEAEERELLELERLDQIFAARESLWEFQKITAPQDYTEDRTYLIILSLCLQSFYQDEPVSYLSNLPIEHHELLDLSQCTIKVELEDQNDKTLITVDTSGTDILIVEVPPRHHKSHSLINFECWILGQDPKQIMITASYNSKLANEFSQYVRDGIEEVRIKPFDIIYPDIFPETRTKHGDRSKERWALEGTFLSYTGAGIMAGIMGKGGNLIIIDDPIKGSLEAFNENHLDKVWNAYSNSWLSRLEKPRKQILVMTPWIEGDPGDRIIKGAVDSGEIIKIFNCKAYTETQGMLCEDILDKRAFDILTSRLDPIILSGNYLCQRLGMAGKLYTSFNFYTAEEQPETFDEMFCYIDTADMGSDFLCSPFGGIKYGKDAFGIPIKKAYILDVLYTQEGLEVTEEMMVDFLVQNNIQNSVNVKVESQAGGGYYATNVKNAIRANYPKEKIYIESFHQSENKNARINANSNTVMKYVYFPADWRTRNKHWTGFSEALMKYSKEGGNAHDDAPDAVSGLAEHINTEITMLEALSRRRNR